ncbi:MAG: N-glycosylase, partial [Candidatus Aenigmatarchaeota archaeon]
MMIMKEIESLLKLYNKRKSDIKKFLKNIKNNDDYILGELYFCLLTPQSKAKKCRDIVNELKSKNLLFNPKLKEIKRILKGAGHRFPNKAEYIVKVNKNFKEIKNNLERDWLVKNVKGFGMKESSHFLRNIGFRNVAILIKIILPLYINIQKP